MPWDSRSLGRCQAVDGFGGTVHRATVSGESVLARLKLPTDLAVLCFPPKSAARINDDGVPVTTLGVAPEGVRRALSGHGGAGQTVEAESGRGR